ncbi:acyltransferase [Paraburkholderia sp. ZP32-5]|uniref:acyltransferase n=1 Tax=Paraburkholderia sp. ZP32-5 TaxID=2883245 RepID=UPI001F1935B4|nr:acyltransferase [Paraburkholderia sp. ZP32-5]
MNIGIFFKIRNRLSTSLQGLAYPFFFARFGARSRILRPIRIDGSNRMEIGNGVFINNFAWIETIHTAPALPRLAIQDGVYIGNSAHIIATQSIEIGRDVLIADRVYIADYIHGYQDIKLPIKTQELVLRRPVEIGSGSWIGENVVILGAKIGRNCVIGANAVVSSDIPDFCVAVGAPARVVRHWNPDSRQWEKGAPTAQAGAPVGIASGFDHV